MRAPLAKLLAAAGAASLCLPAAAAARAENGPIVFSARRSGERVIYTRMPDRSQLRVAIDEAGSGEPAVSPLGRRIAYRHTDPDGPHIWIYDLEAGPRQLTAAARDGEPTWSPAGDALAFSRGSAGRRDIWTVFADGTRLDRLTVSRADDRSPSWSPNGRIAFVRRDRRGDDIWVVPATGGRARRLTASRLPDTDPAWSPSGRTLAFARGRSGQRDIYLLSANGRNRRQVTSFAGDETQPAWSPDGRYLAFTHTRAGERRIYVMRTSTGRVVKLTSASSAASAPAWQPAGLDPVIGAVGDIACDPDSPNFDEEGLGTGPFCRQLDTSNLLLRLDLWSMLLVGDIQYEDATLDQFRRSFDLSWGRAKRLFRPVPGNHEYNTPGASGYFDYFNGPGEQTGPAGDRAQGYYSFDLGRWHLIALNSECQEVGGCGPEDPQARWLKADLAAHPARCTLAYFHYPRFSSGSHAVPEPVQTLWDLLYSAGADLILNGHDHTYERFAPQDPQGNADLARGIREFVVGMGGKTHHGFPRIAPNSEVRDNTRYGLLRLVLRPTRYEWRDLATPNGRVMDSGSTACHD